MLHKPCVEALAKAHGGGGGGVSEGRRVTSAGSGRSMRSRGKQKGTRNRGGAHYPNRPETDNEGGGSSDREGDDDEKEPSQAAFLARAAFGTCERNWGAGGGSSCSERRRGGRDALLAAQSAARYECTGFLRCNGPDCD